MKEDLDMTQRELDIAAIYTSKWGVASLVLFFAYLQPFFFGETLTQMTQQALYLLSFTFVIKSLDFMNFNTHLIFYINDFSEYEWSPPGKINHHVQLGWMALSLVLGTLLVTGAG